MQAKKAKHEDTVESTITSVAARVSDRAPRAEGGILLHCTDTGEEFAVEGLGRRVRISREAGRSEPLVQVRAPSAVIRAVLAGEMPPSRALTGGGVRVRGDVAYLEAILKDLELLECQ